MEILIATYHLHAIIDHFTIALCGTGIFADLVGYIILYVFGNMSVLARRLSDRLRRAAIVLLIPGALSAVLSRLTGESEAERVWDSISPAAQQILLSDNSTRWFFSHAVLGTYLMYALVALAAWRAVLEIWAKIQRTQSVYLTMAIIVLCALLYQGKTGGDLVYGHRVGTNTAATAQRDP
ncbi:MAG: DUF2231 domain-containing protein [Deltaproteobacteria bacterium]|nr:DUF2231 domain-containing protein [Deltaproteobacteria bacterium]